MIEYDPILNGMENVVLSFYENDNIGFYRSLIADCMWELKITILYTRIAQFRLNYIERAKKIKYIKTLALALPKWYYMESRDSIMEKNRMVLKFYHIETDIMGTFTGLPIDVTMYDKLLIKLDLEKRVEIVEKFRRLVSEQMIKKKNIKKAITLVL